MVIVQLCAFGADGDSLYRIHEPARALTALPGTTVVDAHLLGRNAFALARRADLLIVHFANDWGLADLVRERRTAGRPTVFEANDDFFDLQPWNPIAPAWADPAVPALYRHLLRTADAVQTSTETLARRWRAMGAREAAVFDNHLAAPPPPLPPARVPGPAQPLTVGWAGSPGHLADLHWVAPTLLRWLDANPGTRLAMMGAEPARALLPLPPERLVLRPFGERAEYLAFLDSLDVGLAPLLPTAYNRGRSDVKHLEYASRGVAGLYSDLDPYRAGVRPGETGLLFADLAGLAAGLDQLAGDAGLRGAIRVGAHARAVRERRLADHAPTRLAWYAGLLARAGPAWGPGLEELPGYHAVDLDAAEAALAGPDTDGPGAAASLDALLAGVPDHRGAALQRARIHPGQPSRGAVQARVTLAAALASHPGDSALRTEHARALYLGGEPEAARADLEGVLARDPACLPAWRYRLRLAAVTGEAEAAALAARAAAVLPESGEIALLGAELLPDCDRAAALAGAIADPGGRLSRPERGPFTDRLAGLLAGVRPMERACALLTLAVAQFPEAAALAVAHGRALRMLGQEAQGLAEEARAAGLTAPLLGSPAAGPALVAQLAAYTRDALAEPAR